MSEILDSEEAAALREIRAEQDEQRQVALQSAAKVPGARRKQTSRAFGRGREEAEGHEEPEFMRTGGVSPPHPTAPSALTRGPRPNAPTPAHLHAAPLCPPDRLRVFLSQHLRGGAFCLISTKSIQPCAKTASVAKPRQK